MEDHIKVGDKIHFYGEKQGYVVKARNDRFAICTKPFNLKKTVFYTIIDFEKWIRSTNDYVFKPYDYKDIKDIEESLLDLEKGEYELSRRNQVDLHIWKITQKSL